ncbi:uncharacterized protein TNCV_132211 [Trichonephila clavipes]|nr:uncharacterized protein TNCV_132211 [Trichonephila clavipes]
MISGRVLRAASFDQEIHEFISRDVNMGRDPLKVDVSIFCYDYELIDYSNAHEVIPTSPVLQVLNGELRLSVKIQMLLESVLLTRDSNPSSIAINFILRVEQFSG